MGITRPDAGELRLVGERVLPGDTRQRQRIGYVAQEQHFYDWMTPEALGKFVGAFYPTWRPTEWIGAPALEGDALAARVAKGARSPASPALSANV